MVRLAVDSLSLTLAGRRLLEGVSFSVEPGEVLGLVGESGSGKSLTALSIIGLTPAGAALSGSVRLDGVELLGLDEAAMTARRGRDIGLVFQEPMTALNPLMPIGEQVAESVRRHRGVSRAEARAVAAETLARVGLAPDHVPPSRYPHALSGGQRQRAAIAIAVALAPKLILADEPTTALDVTTQARIVRLLVRLAREDGAGLVLISHDLALVAETADQVAVMQDGRIVERGAARSLFAGASHPYARALAEAAEPRLRRPRPPSPDPPVLEAPVLEARGLVRDYRMDGGWFRQPRVHRAVDQVSFTLSPGESLGLVGESGSGKTSLARAILGLDPGAVGEVRLSGQRFDQARGAERRRLRRQIQAVFQDPASSFDPRWRVGDIIAEPFALMETPPEPAERRRRVAAMLEQVGLAPADAGRWPHQFSGGQRQRIAIARALVIEPQVVVLDEATSALDATVRAQVLALLEQLSRERGAAMLFIAHDLAVVRAVTDRVMVMQAGRIVEAGATERVFTAPQHPYTAELLAASPSLSRTLGR